MVSFVDVYLCRIWALVRHERRNAGFTSYPTLALHYLCITIARFEVTLELVKIKIFRSKNFNLFYYFRPKMALESFARAPTLRRKKSQTPRKIFLRNVEITNS